MIGIPTAISVLFVWLPAFASVGLSFTRWDGIGLDSISWVGLRNYREIFTIYPPFFPALWHNVIWLAFFLLIPTPIGLLLATLLDKELRFTRIYQSAIFLPVVLSLAIVGFIWQLMYSTDQGLINAVIAKFGVDPVDWLGNPQHQPVGGAGRAELAARRLRDGPLPGRAEGRRPDAARRPRRSTAPAAGRRSGTSCSRRLRPINIVVLVVTVIESLRAFDLVFVINGGRNGLELLSVLVTQNIIGEASRIGYGSAIATIMLLISPVFIVL